MAVEVVVVVVVGSALVLPVVTVSILRPWLTESLIILANIAGLLVVVVVVVVVVLITVLLVDTFGFRVVVALLVVVVVGLLVVVVGFFLIMFAVDAVMADGLKRIPLVVAETCRLLSSISRFSI